MGTNNLSPGESSTRSHRGVLITVIKTVVAVGAIAVIVMALKPTRSEAQDWKVAQTKETTDAYRHFHRKYPDSPHLTAVTADVECSQNVSTSSGGYGTSGTASLSSLNVVVYGHPELSGEYRANEAGARSLIERYKKGSGTIGTLPHAHLLIAEVKGRPRIVAVGER